jgi:hypothetical protein
MRQKVVSALLVVKGATQREESPRKTKVGLLRLWSYIWMEKHFEQASPRTHLV